MSLTNAFKPATVPQRRYGHKFTGQKFKPRFRPARKRRHPRPKWMR